MRLIFLILILLFSFGCSNVPDNQTSQTSATVAASPQVEIRGNKNSKIYHWKGCPNYDDIKPSNRVIFHSVQEAEAAGYRAAKNCRTAPPR